MSDKDLFLRLKTIFLEWYEQQKEVPYYFTGKDAGNMKTLITKLKFIGAKKHEGESNDWIVDAFKWLLSNLDEWTKKNATIPIINSRFNEIMANGRNSQKQKFLDNYNAFKK